MFVLFPSAFRKLPSPNDYRPSDGNSVRNPDSPCDRTHDFWI